MDPEKNELLVRIKDNRNLILREKYGWLRTAICMYGYSIIVPFHIATLLNLVMLRANESPIVTKDPRIVQTRSMIFGYLTTYVVIMQILYCAYSAVLHMVVLVDKKVPIAPVLLRELLFASIVWPCSMVTFTVFWVLYFYDRSLIYPDYMDSIVDPVSKHILHTFIGPVVILDVILRKRYRLPKNMLRLFEIVETIVSIVYPAIVVLIFYVRGVWVYPFLEVAYNNDMIIYVFFIFLALYFFFYRIQWPLNFLIYGFPKMATYKVVNCWYM